MLFQMNWSTRIPKFTWLLICDPMIQCTRRQWLSELPNELSDSKWIQWLRMPWKRLAATYVVDNITKWRFCPIVWDFAKDYEQAARPSPSWTILASTAGVPSPMYLHVVYHLWEPRRCPTVSPTRPVHAWLDYMYHWVRPNQERVSGMLINYLQVYVNEVHYIEHQTHGKGRGTWPQFKAKPLLLNIIKLPQPQFKGGLNLEEASIQGTMILVTCVHVHVSKDEQGCQPPVTKKPWDYCG